MTFKRWEIWWAKVKFEDSEEVKRRPVLIINSNVVAIIAYKMTSTNRGDKSPNYQVREWKAAGLTKETSIRFDKVLRLNASDFDTKIGELTERDRLLISNRLQI